MSDLVLVDGASHPEGGDRSDYHFDVRVDPLPSVPEIRLLGRVRTTRAGQHYLPLHRHRDLELAYVCRGSVRWFAQGKTCFLNAGQAFLTMPATPHGGGQDTLQPSELLWIQLIMPADEGGRFLDCPPDQTAALLTALGRLDGTVVGRVPEVGRILDELMATMGHEDTPATAFKVRANLLYLLQRVIDAAERPHQVSPMISRAIQIMEADLSTRLTVASIARDTGLSPSHFQHLFRAEIGVGPAEFHLNLRLSESERMLANTDDSILTIALNLGFSSSQHFATTFKQVFGLSPRAYRLAARLPVAVRDPDDIVWTL